MSNWLVAIVGGAIATVVGGLILFYILPSQQVPGLPPPLAATGQLQLKCTMSGGVMDGRVYSFSIDTVKGTAAWADHGAAMRVVHFDAQRIRTIGRFRLLDLPEHDYIGFNFNRLTLAVEGFLFREPTLEEVSKCGSQSYSRSCGSSSVVGEPSHGTCGEIARAF